MSDLTLTKTRLFEGVWEGILETPDTDKTRPSIQVTHLEKAIPGVQVLENIDAGNWVVKVPIPVEVIGDGVQVFLISDTQSGKILDSFTLLSGEALGDDIRAEMMLLREELDMLKRAFRRHCLDAM